MKNVQSKLYTLTVFLDLEVSIGFAYTYTDLTIIFMRFSKD